MSGNGMQGSSEHPMTGTHLWRCSKQLPACDRDRLELAGLIRGAAAVASATRQTAELSTIASSHCLPAWDVR